MADEPTDARALLASMAGRAQHHVTSRNGRTVTWFRWGRGRPLLLLHGAHGFWGHWYRNIEALAQDRAMLVPDIPGMGGSDRAEADDHAALVHPLACGLATLIGAELPVDVIGFSFGGVLAAHLASHYPSLVRRLVVVDPGGIGTALGDFSLSRMKGLDGEERAAALRANLMAIMLHHPESADDLAMEIYRQGVERCRINPGPLVMPDHLVTALTRSAVPLDAIWGAMDTPHPAPEMQEAALRRFRPHLRFRVVDDAGHWCMYERPEAFNDTLRELLALDPL